MSSQISGQNPYASPRYRSCATTPPNEEDFDSFFRPESLEKIFGRACTNQSDFASKRQVALLGMREILADWFDGKTLLEIENTITGFIRINEGQVRRPTRPDRKAKFARRFSNRFASEISFVMSALSQLVSEVELANGIDLGPVPSFLPQLVRFGHPTPYHFAVSREMSTSGRISAQRQYERISLYIEQDPTDDWDAVRSKVSTAMVLSLFTDEADDDIEF